MEKNTFKLSEAQQSADVVVAVQRYVKANSRVPRFFVTCERIEGPFARVSVKDNDGKAESLFGFAKRNAENRWEVLALGTFFEPGFFKQHGIPERLRTP